MPTKEIATSDKARESVDLIFEKHREAFVAASPVYTEADRAIRIAKNAILGNPTLMQCTGASLLSGIMESMQLGLVLDGCLGHAYLVPFNNRRAGTKEAQLIPGYKGLMELAYRSSRVLSIECDIVREGDHFEFERGTNPRLSHRPNFDSTAKITHVWACAICEGGANPFVVMSRDEVEKIRKKAKSQSGPWCDYYEEMAKKTAIRRLCKYLPASPDLQRAVSLQERADAGLPPVPIVDAEGTVVDDVTPEVPPEPKKRKSRKDSKGSDWDGLSDDEVPF